MSSLGDATSELFTEKYSDFLFDFLMEGNGIDCILFCLVTDAEQQEEQRALLEITADLIGPENLNKFLFVYG